MMPIHRRKSMILARASPLNLMLLLLASLAQLTAAEIREAPYGAIEDRMELPPPPPPSQSPSPLPPQSPSPSSEEPHEGASRSSPVKHRNSSLIAPRTFTIINDILKFAGDTIKGLDKGKRAQLEKEKARLEKERERLEKERAMREEEEAQEEARQEQKDNDDNDDDDDDTCKYDWCNAGEDKPICVVYFTNYHRAFTLRNQKCIEFNNKCVKHLGTLAWCHEGRCYDDSIKFCNPPD